MTQLGIVAALPPEAHCLTKGPFKTGCLHPIAENVALALSGIGPENARSAAQKLLSHGAKALLSWGCAGALSHQTPAGSLLLPTSVLGPDAEAYQTDAAWHARLHACLHANFPIHSGPICTSIKVLADPSQKQALHIQSGAIAVDMESAALAELAHEYGLPFIAIRAIADDAETIIPASVLSAFDATGKLRLPSLFAAVLLRPKDWRGLLRLGRGFRLAQGTLTAVAKLAGPGLLAP